MTREVRQQKDFAAIADVTAAILDAHFSSFTTDFIRKLTSSWSHEGADSEGLEQALEYLYNAVNFSRDNFKDFLEENFSVLKDQKEFANGYHNLDVLSKHCSGSIDDDDPVVRQCQALSNLSPITLKNQIGLFFKEAANGHLEEKFPELIQKIKRGSEAGAANSNVTLG